MWDDLDCVVEIVVVLFFIDDVFVDFVGCVVVVFICYVVGEVFVVFEIEISFSVVFCNEYFIVLVG